MQILVQLLDTSVQPLDGYLEPGCLSLYFCAALQNANFSINN